MVKSNRLLVMIKTLGVLDCDGTSLGCGLTVGTRIDGKTEGPGLGLGLSEGVSLGAVVDVGLNVFVGPFVGFGLGAGELVGVSEGKRLVVGTIRVGAVVGPGDGCGLPVGLDDGVALTDGFLVLVGAKDGDGDGAAVSVGTDEGVADGRTVGAGTVGVAVGKPDGDSLGEPVGEPVGEPDGGLVGTVVEVNSGDANANGCSVGTGTIDENKPASCGAAVLGGTVGKRFASCGAAVGDSVEVGTGAQPHPAAAARTGRSAQESGLTKPKAAAISRLPQERGC